MFVRSLSSLLSCPWFSRASSRSWLRLEVLAGAICLAAAAHAQTTYTVTTLSDNAATPPSGSLRAAIISANSAGGANTIHFSTGLSGTIALAGDLPAIQDDGLTIDGAGALIAISGGNAYRCFLVGAWTPGTSAQIPLSVTIANLAFSGCEAQGGAGGAIGEAGSASGGGGAGLGGAVFVAAGANVTLSNIGFSSNNAAGGAGGAGTVPPPGGVETATGGGGMGGNGGAGSAQPDYTGGTGGGGLGVGADGASTNSGNPGGPGIALGAAAGGAGGTAGCFNSSQQAVNSTGTPGGASGGGGGGNVGYLCREAFGGGGGVGGGVGGYPGGPTGGAGGFGGGGGGIPFSNGAPGGFGGGGGGSIGVAGQAGGAGGFGGGGGGGALSGATGGAGGFGAGNGATGSTSIPSDALGGGGLGAGGAVFVQQGGNLTFTGPLSESGDTVTPGMGGNNGSAFGTAIFLQGDYSVVNFAPAAGTTETVSGGIADQSGSGGTGANAGVGGVLMEGAGTLVLSGTNTYTGPTTVASGTLDVDGSLSAATTVYVSAGATLGGSGVVNGDVVLLGSGAAVDTSHGLSVRGTETTRVPFTLAANEGTPQTGAAGFSFAKPLSVLLEDSNGNPVSGQTVYFFPPGAGASATLSALSCVTAAPSGSCSVTATANGAVGSYSVTAVAGGANAVSFALTNVPANFVVNTAADNNSGSCTGQVLSTANTTDASCTLRAAMALGVPDIYFDAAVFSASAPQTITLVNGPLQIAPSTVNSLPVSPALPLNIHGPGAKVLTISGNGSSGVFNLEARVVPSVFNPNVDVANNVTISGVTIANGNVSQTALNNTYGAGGGIYYGLGTLTLSSVTFAGNSASGGGAIFALGSVAVGNSAFTNNQSTFIGGGAIQAEGAITVANSTFTSNETTANDLVGGGAILAQDALTVANSTFLENTGSASAVYGGGAILAEGSATVTTSTFTSNTLNATGSYGGGAILFLDLDSPTGKAFPYDPSTLTVTVANNTFTGNTSESTGGAIDSWDVLTSVTGNTFAGNDSGLLGGAIHADLLAGQAAFVNNTFLFNGSTAGGAIVFAGTAPGTAANNIVSGNLATNGGPGIANGTQATISNSSATAYATLNASNNVYYANQINGVEGDCVNCTSNTDAISAPSNPAALALSNYGGPTQTLLPQLDSAALCNGSASAAAAAGITADQRGVALNLTSSNAAAYTGAGGYCPAGSLDAGSVQTSYALSFTTQPQPISPAAGIYTQIPFQAAITVDENGTVVPASGISIPIYLTTSGSPIVTNESSAVTTNGVASDSALLAYSPGSTTATASVQLSTSPAVTISTTSNSFNVVASSAPAFTSANHAGFAFNQNNLFTVTTTGAPTPLIGFSCPGSSFYTYGLSFADNGDGTATISGTPNSQASPGTSFTCTLKASNALGPDATQSFTLSFGYAVAVSSLGSLEIPYRTASQRLVATVTYASGIIPTGAFTFQVGSGAAVTATCSPISSTKSVCVASAYPTGTLAPATYPITGTQAADSYYLSSSGSGTLTVSAPPVVSNVAGTAIAYGTANDRLIANVTYTSGHVPTGTFTFQVGSGSVVAAQCAQVNSTENVCAATYPTNGLLPGTYTITATEAADSYYGSSSGTGTLTVTGTASLGTPTFSPAATEPQGTGQAITISDTLSYNGVQPTGAVAFALNGVAYVATCGASGSPETCSATVPAATIAALAPNAYTVTAALAADSIYGATSGISGIFTITPTVVFSSGASSLVAPGGEAAGSSVAVTATLVDTYGNPINGATVTFSAVNYNTGQPSATASFSPASGVTSGGGVFSATLTDTAVETLTVTATVSGPVSGSLTVSTEFVAPNYTVFTLTDPSSGNGTPGNCVAAGLSGDNSNCSLRDAVAAADALSGVTANIGFAPLLTAHATTANPAVIAIAQSTPITLSASMNINGPGANLLTISGGATPLSPSNNPIFDQTGGTIAVSGMTLANGYNPSGGGAIQQDSGALTVANCFFSGNYDSGYLGGAIQSSSALTVTGSTFSGNYDGSYGGGAIAADGSLTVANSTFLGNSTSGAGGAITWETEATIVSSTFSGNSAQLGLGGLATLEGLATVADSIFSGDSPTDILFSYFTLGGGNIVDSGEGNSLNLSPLGYYGGAVPTLLPLPGSSAICAGVEPELNGAPLTTDERGEAISPTRYGQSACYDSGAVQTDYGLSFRVEPPAGGAPGVALAPAPAVAVTESGVPLTAGAATVTIADADGDLSGASTATASTSTLPASAGQAAFGNLLFKGAAAGDTLTATLTLNANLAPSALALAATSSAFNISQTTPVVSFAPAVSTQAYGAAIPSAALDATASANQAPVAGSFAYTTTIAGAAHQPVVAGTTVLPAGSYTITAAFTPADASLYTPASATAAYTVTPASQTIHFAGLPMSVAYSAGLQYTLNATATSGLPVSYSATGPATLNGTTLTITGAGAVRVTASQSGNANYAAAAPVTLTVQVAPAAQKITFNAVPTQTGGVPLNLALYASASSGLPLTFTSETTAVCAVSGSVATVVSVGKCTIQASQPGGSGYAAAAPVAQSFETQKGQQTISFGSIPSPLYVGGKVTLAPTSTSGLPVTLGTGTPAVCTVSGDTVTLVEGGGCNVDATVPGNAIFYPGLGNTGIIVHRLTQIVTLDAVASPQSVGNSVKLGATSNAGLTGFTFASLSTAVCTVAGNTATMVAAGNCYLQACQPGSVDYLPACGGQLVKSDQVKQTIAFGSIPATLYAGGAVKITATASSGLTPVALASTTPAVCTFSGGTATLLQFGDCDIQATQAGNAKYAAATANLSFLVHHAQ